jgi:uncharacterized protein with GYD domain
MATYIMFGNYTLEGMKGISAARSDKARALVKKLGGEIKAIYALLGAVDLVVILELPDAGQAMKASAKLARTLGITFTTSPAVTVEEFDKLMA